MKQIQLELKKWMVMGFAAGVLLFVSLLLALHTGTGDNASFLDFWSGAMSIIFGLFGVVASIFTFVELTGCSFDD